MSLELLTLALLKYHIMVLKMRLLVNNVLHFFYIGNWKSMLNLAREPLVEIVIGVGENHRVLERALLSLLLHLFWNYYYKPM
jgi:hypothetical protein